MGHKLRILIINVKKKKGSNTGLIKSGLISFSKLHDIKMFHFARLQIESRAFFVSASQTSRLTLKNLKI